MAQIQILAVCGNEGILATILRLINANNDWHTSGAADVDTALALLQTKSFNVVLLGSGFENSGEQRLSTTVAQNIPVILHYGGGSGLLFGEIYETLARR